MTLFGQEHVERYRATDREEGHEWRGTQTLLLLTTKRRKSGEQRTTPLAAAEKPEIRKTMVSEWPDCDAYQRKTEREIPVVVLERV